MKKILIFLIISSLILINGCIEEPECVGEVLKEKQCWDNSTIALIRCTESKITNTTEKCPELPKIDLKQGCDERLMRKEYNQNGTFRWICRTAEDIGMIACTTDSECDSSGMKGECNKGMCKFLIWDDLYYCDYSNITNSSCTDNRTCNQIQGDYGYCV